MISKILPSFSWSLEQFFLKVDPNNFGNKIPILFHKNGSLHNFYIMTLPERLSIFGCIVNFCQNANVQSQNWDVGYGFNNYDFHPSQINRNISWVVSQCGCYNWGFIGKHWMVSFQFQKPVKYKQKIIGEYLSSFKWNFQLHWKYIGCRNCSHKSCLIYHSNTVDVFWPQLPIPIQPM